MTVYRVLEATVAYATLICTFYYYYYCTTFNIYKVLLSHVFFYIFSRVLLFFERSYVHVFQYLTQNIIILSVIQHTSTAHVKHTSHIITRRRRYLRVFSDCELNSSPAAVSLSV